MSARRMYFHNKKKDESATLSYTITVPANGVAGSLYMGSKINQDVVINYGDGYKRNVTIDSSKDYVEVVAEIVGSPGGNYYYENAGTYTITITVTDRFQIDYIYFRMFGISNGPFGNFDQNIVLFKNLEFFGGQDCYFDNLTDSVYDLEFITHINFTSFFKLNEKIPDQVFNKPLKFLRFQGSNNWASNNFEGIEKIYLLAPTLDELLLTGLGLNFTQNDIPNLGVESFANLVNLTKLTIMDAPNFTLPSVINQITSLTFLNIRDSQGLHDYNTISSLVNLEYLGLLRCLNTLTNIDTLSNLTELKTLDVRGVYRTLGRMNEFVDNLYTLVTNNASITGTNTSFRNMTIMMNLGSDAIPTGTYQQPSGYVQSSSNGNPNTQKEKIWVLVNQYNHSIAYNS